MASREYPTVLKVSSNPDALLKAHKTHITIEQANSLIFAYLDEDEISEVKFQRKSMSGYASRDNKVMMLPKTPTIGIVLHEVAHFIHFSQLPKMRRGTNGKRIYHVEDYTKILDGLVLSEKLWKAHPYTEEELFQ